MAVNVRGRSGLLEVILAAAPKLPHRHIGVFFAKELLGDRRHEDSHRLGHQPHAFFTGPLLGHAVVVLRDQFTDREPVIPEETLGLFLVPHDATRQRREPGPEVVATAFSEFLGHARRPIRTLRLPTVQQQEFEGAAGLVGRILPDRVEHLVDVEVHRLRAHFVALEARRGGGLGGHSRAGVADPEQRPLALGSLPLGLARQVDDVFRIRAGKRLGRRVTEIAIVFKRAPQQLFEASQTSQLGQNALVIRVQPDEGVTIRFGSKVPGVGMQVRDVTMDFGYGHAFTEASPEAYERLILDVLLGDPPLFPRHEEVELSWKILDPIEEYWAKKGKPEQYRPGSWGPASADQMMAQDGRAWRIP